MKFLEVNRRKIVNYEAKKCVFSGFVYSKRTLEDENTLLFVSLHEVAHIMTKSIGHTKEFWDNFTFYIIPMFA